MKHDNMKMWEQLAQTDPKFTKPFDRGSFKGTAVDPLYNIQRVTEILGPVGFKWGWTIVENRLDTFGVGEDAQTIHTVVLRVWFEDPEGTIRHVEHMGHTKASYWTRARNDAKPRFVVDEEYGKKSVTDALAKVLSCLGASADVHMGQFDGNKYVHGPAPPPPRRTEPTPTDPGPNFPGYLYHPMRDTAPPATVSPNQWLARASDDIEHANDRQAIHRWWDANKPERHRLHGEQPRTRGPLEELRIDVTNKLEQLSSADRPVPVPLGLG
jgi:hypothetical protein